MNKNFPIISDDKRSIFYLLHLSKKKGASFDGHEMYLRPGHQTNHQGAKKHTEISLSIKKFR